MTVRNISGYLPNLLGPVVISWDGVDQTARPTLNFKGGVLTDDDTNDRLDLDFGLHSSGSLKVYNPAGTFYYSIAGSAILANRTLTLPLLTAGDTVVCEAFAQTLTNKTFNVADNSLTATSGAQGDLLYHNGTKYVRLAKGTALQVLRVNAGATDIEWAASAAGSTPTGTGFTHITAGVQDAASKLVENADVDAAAAIAGSKIDPDFGAQNIATTGTSTSAYHVGSGNIDNAGTGTLDNVSTTGASTIRFTGAAPDVTGFDGGTHGRRLILMAVGGPIILQDEGGTSDAANRIALNNTAAPATYYVDSCAELIYDGTTQRWRELSGLARA